MSSDRRRSITIRAPEWFAAFLVAIVVLSVVVPYASVQLGGPDVSPVGTVSAAEPMATGTIVDDFEDGDIGGWGIDPGSFAASTEESVSGSYSVKATDGSSYLSKSLSETSAASYSLWMYTRDSGGASGEVGFGLMDGTTTNADRMFNLWVDPQTGSIGSDSADGISCSVNLDTWYRYKVIPDYANNNVDLEIYNGSGGLVCSESNLAQVDNVGISAIRLNAIQSGAQGSYWDYILFNPSELRTVSGTVKSDNGAALDGATVTVNSTSDTATTSADGSYSLNLGDGDYKLTANKTGYNNNSTTVTVSGADVSNANLTLSGDAVSGTVVDPNGDPVSNATVVVRAVRQKAITTVTGTDNLDKAEKYLAEARNVDPPDDWNPDYDPIPTANNFNRYMVVHEGRDWGFSGGVYSGPENVDLDEPQLIVPSGNDVTVSVWRDTDIVFGFGSRPVISDLPGRPVTEEYEVTLTKLDPDGETIADPITVDDIRQSHEPGVSFGTNIRNLLYRQLKPDVTFARIPASSLSAGFYRVESTATDQSFIMVYGNPAAITDEWASEARDKANNLLSSAKDIDVEIQNSNFTRAVVEADSDGDWSTNVDTRVVAVSVRAYDAPDSDAADSALSGTDLNDQTLPRVSQLLSDQRQQALSSWSEAETEEEREDAVSDMPGVIRYSGQPKRVEIPADNVTLTVRSVYSGAYSGVVGKNWSEMSLEQRIEALFESRLISDPTPNDESDRDIPDNVLASDPADSLSELFDIREDYQKLVGRSDQLVERYERLARNSSLPGNLQSFDALDSEDVTETEVETQIDVLEETLLGGTVDRQPRDEDDGDEPDQSENETDIPGGDLPGFDGPTFDVPFLGDDTSEKVQIYNLYPLPNRTVRGVEVGATVAQDRIQFAEPLGPDETFEEAFNDSQYDEYAATYKIYLDGELHKRGTVIQSKQVSARLPENLSEGTHTWSIAVNSSYYGVSLETKKIAFTAESDAQPARDVLQEDEVFGGGFFDPELPPDRSPSEENATEHASGSVDGWVSATPSPVNADETFEVQTTVYGAGDFSGELDPTVRVMLARTGGDPIELGSIELTGLEQDETLTQNVTVNQDAQLNQLSAGGEYGLVLLFNVSDEVYQGQVVEPIIVEVEDGIISIPDPIDPRPDDETERDLTGEIYHVDYRWIHKGEFRGSAWSSESNGEFLSFPDENPAAYETNTINQSGTLSVLVRKNASDTEADVLNVRYKGEDEVWEQSFDIETVNETTEFYIDALDSPTDATGYTYYITGDATIDSLTVRAFGEPGSGGPSPDEGDTDEDVTESPDEARGIGSVVLGPEPVEVIRTTTSNETTNGTDIISGRIETTGELSPNALLFMSFAESGLRKVDEQYYSIDNNTGSGDDVVIQDLPVDENRTVTRFEVVDVASDGDVRQIVQPVEDETSPAEPPTIEAITASTLYPAVGESVTVAVEPGSDSSFEEISNATVLGPSGKVSTNVTEDGDVRFTPDTNGLHRVRIKMATVNGGTYTETIALEATERPLDFAPRVRLRSTEYGIYAIGGRSVKASSVTLGEEGSVQVAVELDRPESVNRVQVEMGPVSLGERVTVRVLDAQTQRLVQRQVALDLVVGTLPSSALVRRNGEPISPAGTRFGTIDRTGDGVVIRTYTTDQGSAELTVTRNPSALERLNFWLDTNFPDFGVFGLIGPIPLAQGVGA